MKELIEEAIRMLTITTEALKEIRNTQGKVCNNFGLCDHKACQSSYSSWMIANEALSKLAFLE